MGEVRVPPSRPGTDWIGCRGLHFLTGFLLGDGIISRALTARVGVAAMDVCRPLPFAALPRPKVSNLVGRALTGLFQRDGRGEAPTER